MTLKEEKDLKEEIAEILHPEKKGMHPPRATIPKELKEEIMNYDLKPIVGETSVGEYATMEPSPVKDHRLTDSRSTIDFNAMANASEFQRFVYWILTGETFRGSTKALKMKIRNTSEKIKLVRGLPSDVLKELKEVLEKRKIKDV